ncbi:unnamed protein product, partial [marine sediment metagenome]
EQLLTFGPWQALERAVARLLIHSDYDDVRLVGKTGDAGADILAKRFNRHHLIQVKYR